MRAQITGAWDAELVTPGGALRFGLSVSSANDEWQAVIKNGPEKIKIVDVQFDNGQLELAMPHFDSWISARYTEDADELSGTWTKIRGKDKKAKLVFNAHRPKDRSPVHAETLHGKWRAQFSSADEPSIALFRPDQTGTWATFLTTTGDYRYLRARLNENELELSCFDGGHAFLMRGTLIGDRIEDGHFWSGDWWHETWTAARDESIALPNAFHLSEWNQDIELSSLQFPDLDGNPQHLYPRSFRGHPVIVEIFGSWCPNCHDAGAYLSELLPRHKDLRVVGLAFELTGDFPRDARQVRSYCDRHKLGFPVLIGGLADKAKASEAFPALDRIRAYPTLIFIDIAGRVRGVYTGFSGPATGEAHEKLRAEIDALIESCRSTDADE